MQRRARTSASSRRRGTCGRRVHTKGVRAHLGCKTVDAAIAVRLVELVRAAKAQTSGNGEGKELQMGQPRSKKTRVLWRHRKPLSVLLTLCLAASLVPSRALAFTRDELVEAVSSKGRRESASPRLQVLTSSRAGTLAPMRASTASMWRPRPMLWSAKSPDRSRSPATRTPSGV